jgi:hypothetical protein
MSFSRKPPATADEFIAAADAPPALATPAPTPATAAKAVHQELPRPTPTPPATVRPAEPTRRQAPAKPWERFDRKATAKNVFNLRLNDYYLAIIRHLANQEEDSSMQRVCKRILLPELEKRVGVR